MKNRLVRVLGLFMIVFGLLCTARPVGAKALDEIQDYFVIVSMNEDATLNIQYTIRWKVLDSTTDGPLTWVKVGLPNTHFTELTALSDTISEISDMKSNGQIYARIDLDRKYHAGEEVIFSFSVRQDYMYEVDKLTEGETVVSLTPGWFDDIEVKNLELWWNSDNVSSASPSCYAEEGWLHFVTELEKGGKYTVSVTYPNTAYGFDLSKSEEYEEPGSDDGDAAVGFLCFYVIIIFVVIILAVKKKSQQDYARGAGLGETKKITRKKIVYYPECQGCGGTREEGQDTCAYCGRSFIKSEETVTEEDTEAAQYKENGTYKSSSHPNTYYHVSVVTVPAPRRSSCAHSSCAHSSCACACACACAGGGRAGCSTKDFYRTGLKLRQLELRRRHKK